MPKRKTDVPSDNETSSVDDAPAESSPAKRGRGRPRTNPPAEPKDPNEPKRPRGRPKSDPSTLKQKAPVVSSGRKRGRPPGSSKKRRGRKPQVVASGDNPSDE